MSENTPTYNQSGWKLTDLFTSFSDPAINLTYQDLEARVEKFVSQREELKPEISSEKFLQLVRELEEMNKLGYRLYGFASLSFAANTQDQTAQINIARFQQFEAEMENRTLFSVYGGKRWTMKTPLVCWMPVEITAIGWSRCAILSPIPSVSRKKKSSTSKMLLVALPTTCCTIPSPTAMYSKLKSMAS